MLTSPFWSHQPGKLVAFSTSMFLIISSVFTVDEEAGSWCSLPAPWSTPKLNCSSRSRHLASLDKVSAELRYHFEGSRSVQAVKKLRLKCRTKHGTAYNTVWHFLSVAVSFRTALVTVYDQLRTSPAMSFSCCCSKIYYTCESNASPPTVYGPATHRNTSIFEFFTTVFCYYGTFFATGLSGETMWIDLFVTSFSTVLPHLRSEKQDAGVH